MDSKDIKTFDGGQEKELSELVELAVKALKLGKSYQAKAKASTKKTQETCEKLESAHQSLELIVSVLKKQIQVRTFFLFAACDVACFLCATLFNNIL
jgi:hypothetical protein